MMAQIRARMDTLVQQAPKLDATRSQVILNEDVMPIVVDDYAHLMDAQAAAFAANLTAADMQALLAFYQSPAGRDYVKAQPQITRSLDGAVKEWVAGLYPSIQAKVRETVAARGWDKPAAQPN